MSALREQNLNCPTKIPICQNKKVRYALGAAQALRNFREISRAARANNNNKKRPDHRRPKGQGRGHPTGRRDGRTDRDPDTTTSTWDMEYGGE